MGEPVDWNSLWPGSVEERKVVKFPGNSGPRELDLRGPSEHDLDGAIESYRTLKPGAGNYRFHVTASNNSSVWNQTGAELDFNIAPAYYQTSWFRGLCVLAFFTLLWAGYQMRVHQLQEQEKKFRDAVETMPALAFVTDPKGNRTFLNRGWLEYTGLSSEQATGSGWEKAIHPDDLKRVTERWLASRTTGKPLDCEVRLRRGSDGVAGSRRAHGQCGIIEARS